MYNVFQSASMAFNCVVQSADRFAIDMDLLTDVLTIYMILQCFSMVFYDVQWVCAIC